MAEDGHPGLKGWWEILTRGYDLNVGRKKDGAPS
jgi:hypothetical protein